METQVRLAVHGAAGVLLLTTVLTTRVRGQVTASFVALPFLGVVIYALLQVVPWPAPIIRLFAPARWELQVNATRAILLDHQPQALPISLAPFHTVMATASWSAAAALLCAAMLLAAERWAQQLLLGSAVAAALLQVVGAAVWRLWAHPWAFGGAASLTLRGTFVNPNHFAFFLEIVAPVALAAAWWQWRRARRGAAVAFLKGGFCVAAWLVLAWGVLLSGSRAGLVAFGLSTIILGVILAWHQRRWVPLWGLVFILTFAAVGGVLVGLQGAVGRWLATVPGSLAWDARVHLWRHTLDLWRRFPLLGTGLGTYRDASSLWSPTTVPQNLQFSHAHNDYLEILVTGGLAGAVLVVLALERILRTLLRRLREAKSTEEVWPAAAALSSAAAALVHAAFDFGLSIPAVNLVLMVILGAGMAQSQAGSEERPTVLVARRSR